MRPLGVEEIQIPSDQPSSLGNGIISPQIGEWHVAMLSNIGFSREFRAVGACTFTRGEEDTWTHIPGAAPRVLSPIITDPVRSTDPSRAARRWSFNH